MLDAMLLIITLVVLLSDKRDTVLNDTRLLHSDRWQVYTG